MIARLLPLLLVALLAGCEAGYVYELDIEPRQEIENRRPRVRLTTENVAEVVDEFVTREGFYRDGLRSPRDPVRQWARDTSVYTGDATELRLRLVEDGERLYLQLKSVLAADEYLFARVIREGLEESLEAAFPVDVVPKLVERTDSN